jgi:hypothetical protein
MTMGERKTVEQSATSHTKGAPLGMVFAKKFQ